MGVAMKRCCKCKLVKPLGHFSKDQSRPDGRQTICKACNKVYRAEHRESLAAYMKEYWQRPAARERDKERRQTPEYRAGAVQRTREWGEARTGERRRALLAAQDNTCPICLLS